MDLKRQDQDVTRLYILKLVPPASCPLYDMHFFWLCFFFFFTSIFFGVLIKKFCLQLRRFVFKAFGLVLFINLFVFDVELVSL